MKLWTTTLARVYRRPRFAARLQAVIPPPWKSTLPSGKPITYSYDLWNLLARIRETRLMEGTIIAATERGQVTGWGFAYTNGYVSVFVRPWDRRRGIATAIRERGRCAVGREADSLPG